MGAQDKTEQVLRKFHLLLSQSRTYEKAKNCIIIDKKEVLTLLKELNVCMYELMEEYELTEQSRAAAERELRRRTDEMIQDANHMAEDVYAASVMYTDEALSHVQDIMQETADSMRQICEKMNIQILEKKASVRRNQSELKSHLESLHDTNKYQKLIEERNKELAKKRAKDKKEEMQPTSYAGVKPEIRINAEYFEKAGLLMPEEEPEEIPSEKPEAVPAEIKVNLDAEYFKWKADEDIQEIPDIREKKQEKPSLFGKILKGEK